MSSMKMQFAPKNYARVAIFITSEISRGGLLSNIFTMTGLIYHLRTQHSEQFTDLPSYPNLNTKTFISNFG